MCIRDRYKEREKYIEAMEKCEAANGIDAIIREINRAAGIE